jgi:hypothetical protein
MKTGVMLSGISLPEARMPFSSATHHIFELLLQSALKDYTTLLITPGENNKILETETDNYLLR